MSRHLGAVMTSGLRVRPTARATPRNSTPTYPQAASFQNRRTFSIVRCTLRAAVVDAIDLENEVQLAAVEIDDEAVNAMLPSKLETKKLAIPDHVPHPPLGKRCFSS